MSLALVRTPVFDFPGKNHGRGQSISIVAPFLHGPLSAQPSCDNLSLVRTCIKANKVQSNLVHMDCSFEAECVWPERRLNRSERVRADSTKVGRLHCLLRDNRPTCLGRHRVGTTIFFQAFSPERANRCDWPHIQTMLTSVRLRCLPEVQKRRGARGLGYTFYTFF